MKTWFSLLLLAAVALAASLYFLTGSAGEPGARGPSLRMALGPEAEEAGASPTELLVEEAEATSAAESERRSLESTPAVESADPLLLSIVDSATRGPVGEARVVLGDPLRAEGISAADGQVLVPWPAGVASLPLTVEHPDYVDLRRLQVVPGEELRVELDRSGAIEGEVLGLTGLAQLLLWESARGRPDDEPDQQIEVRDGRFAFEDLMPGEYALAALGDALPLELESGIFVEGGERAWVQLGPLEARSLRVHVFLRGAKTEDLPGAQVTYRPERDGVSSSLERMAERGGITGEDGRLRLEHLSGGTGVLEVTTPWGARERRELDLSSLEWGEEEVEVRFPAPGRIAGSVSYPDGRPAPGAQVLLVENPRRREHFEPVVEEALVHTVSEEDGSFLLESVPSTKPVMLLAVPADGGPPAFAWRSARNVPPATTRSDFHIVLEDTGRIEGRLVDAEGGPLAGIEVHFDLPVASGYVDWKQVTSDTAGRVVLDQAPARRVRAYVRSEAVSRAAEGLDVPAGDVVEFEWVLDLRYGIDCTVVDEFGFAIEGAYVLARWQGGEDGPGREGSEATDALGRTHIDGLAAGPWTITPMRRGWKALEEPLAIEVPTQAIPVLSMVAEPPPEPVTLQGEVVRAGDGSPIPGLEVGGQRGGILRVDGTRFEVTGVRPGSLRLYVLADHHTVHVFDRIDALPGSVVQLDRVELRAASDVELRMVDPSGKALEGARVGLARAGEPTVRLRHRGGGRYQRSHVPRGTYELQVRRGDERWKLPLKVASRKVRERVELPPSGGR